jgi:23S rRNA (uracil1939-C5)-methyltransferase
MQEDARLEVDIEKAVFRGLGLSHHAGQVVLIRGAYPGERWRVRVIETGRQYLRAETEQALRTIAARRASPCPWFPACGGCSHQDLGYAEQLALKRAVLADALARAGVAWPQEIEVIGSPERAWRMRASLHVEAKDSGVHLGLRASASHRVVDFDICAQLSDRANAAVSGLRVALQQQPELAARTQRVDLAESQAGDRLVAAYAGELSARDLERLTAMAGAVHGIDGLGAVVYRGDRWRFVSLIGEPHVSAAVKDVALSWHVLSFFQANRFLLDALVATVMQGIPAGGSVLDLYGGAGLFALSAAAQADRVICVEGDPISAGDARANAQRAGLSNVRVKQADVLRALRSEAVGEDERIVLDPPRTGLGKGAVQAITSRRPVAVAYVSCDPPTLGRDLAQFAAAGYRPLRMTALDLFPNTFHIETVAHLVRAG